MQEINQHVKKTAIDHSRFAGEHIIRMINDALVALSDDDELMTVSACMFIAQLAEAISKNMDDWEITKRAHAKMLEKSVN